MGGLRAHVAEEVTHISLAVFGSEKDPKIIHSSDPRKPSAYHSSREAALEIAKKLKPHIDNIGFAGPCLELVVPGIPFDQEQDAGMHLSIYNRPGAAANGVNYTPPDLEKAKSLLGREAEFAVEGDIKILNGSEANDMKVGGCYYVSLSCGQAATDAANEFKALLGLPEDPTQKFHLSVATIAPSWMPFHPKSAFALSEHGQEPLKQIAEAFKILRHGDSAVDFPGFNNNEITGWTTHAKTTAEWGRENNAIKGQIAELPQDDNFAAKKAELEAQFRDMKSLGFCNQPPCMMPEGRLFTR